MLNQVVCVGRITKPPEKINEEGNNNVNITLAVPRSFKNENGEYDTDFLKVRLYKGVAESAFVYCNVGDLVGIKGRIQSEDGEMKIIAEKVTFLSSRKTDDE